MTPKVTIIPGKPGSPERVELRNNLGPASDPQYYGATLYSAYKFPAIPAEPERVVLEMDRVHAEIVCTLVGSIAGFSEVRKHSESLFTSLADALEGRKAHTVLVDGVEYTIPVQTYIYFTP